MEITVNKIDIANNQLREAIHLYFEGRDAISIYTLSSASLQICHDILKKTDEEFYRTALVYYAQTAYIKEDSRVLLHQAKYRAKNFLKDRSNYSGEVLTFVTDINALQIYEALQCIEKLEGDNYERIPEHYLFKAWFIIKYTNLLEDEANVYLEKIKEYPSFDKLVTAEISTYAETLAYFRKNPALFKKLIEKQSQAA